MNQLKRRPSTQYPFDIWLYISWHAHVKAHNFGNLIDYKLAYIFELKTWKKFSSSALSTEFIKILPPIELPEQDIINPEISRVIIGR